LNKKLILVINLPKVNTAEDENSLPALLAGRPLNLQVRLPPLFI